MGLPRRPCQWRDSVRSDDNTACGCFNNASGTKPRGHSVTQHMSGDSCNHVASCGEPPSVTVLHSTFQAGMLVDQRDVCRRILLVGGLLCVAPHVGFELALCTSNSKVVRWQHPPKPFPCGSGYRGLGSFIKAWPTSFRGHICQETWLPTGPW